MRVIQDCQTKEKLDPFCVTLEIRIQFNGFKLQKSKFWLKVKRNTIIRKVVSKIKYQRKL